MSLKESLSNSPRDEGDFRHPIHTEDLRKQRFATPTVGLDGFLHAVGFRFQFFRDFLNGGGESAAELQEMFDPLPEREFAREIRHVGDLNPVHGRLGGREAEFKSSRAVLLRQIRFAIE